MLPILGRCNKWHMPWQLTGRKTIKDTCMNKNNLMALHGQKCKNTWHLVLISQCGNIPHATPTLRAPASMSVQTNPNVKIGYLTRFKSLINIRRTRVGDQSLINIPRVFKNFLKLGLINVRSPCTSRPKLDVLLHLN